MTKELYSIIIAHTEKVLKKPKLDKDTKDLLTKQLKRLKKELRNVKKRR